MDLLIALLLGVIQGVTEWLPISSSGHLVIFQNLFGVEEPVLFDAVVHLGTLTAVLAVIRRDVIHILRAVIRGIRDPDVRHSSPFISAVLILIATIPAGVAGLFMTEQIEASFKSIHVAATGLLITGIILISTRGRGGGRILPTAKGAFIIGLFQAFALVPGVSRSGSTIGAGLHLHMDPVNSARFSFLMAVPVISLAGAYELMKSSPADVGPFLLVGYITSAIVGYTALRTLIRIMSMRRFHLFAFYCFGLASIIIVSHLI